LQGLIGAKSLRTNYNGLKWKKHFCREATLTASEEAAMHVVADYKFSPCGRMAEAPVASHGLILDP